MNSQMQEYNNNNLMEARSSYPGTQEKPVRKEKKETKHQNERQKENSGTMKQDPRRTERSLLSMIAAGVVCQAASHLGYGWCVSLLTLLSIGVQGQKIQESKAPHNGVDWDQEMKTRNTETPTKDGTQRTGKVESEQATPRGNDGQCDAIELSWREQNEAFCF